MKSLNHCFFEPLAYLKHYYFSVSINSIFEFSILHIICILFSVAHKIFIEKWTDTMAIASYCLITSLDKKKRLKIFRCDFLFYWSERNANVPLQAYVAQHLNMCAMVIVPNSIAQHREVIAFKTKNGSQVALCIPHRNQEEDESKIRNNCVCVCEMIWRFVVKQQSYMAIENMVRIFVNFVAVSRHVHVIVTKWWWCLPFLVWLVSWNQ